MGLDWGSWQPDKSLAQGECTPQEAKGQMNFSSETQSWV